MARAYGANASLLAAFESTYGSTPVDGYWQLPFVSTSLGSEQGLIANDLIGLGRDPSAPIRDVIKVEGDMVVPLDVRHIGLWLKALLGEPTSVGTGVVTHTFASGKPSLPSLTLETGLPDIPAWFVASGVMVNSLQVGFARSGAANATVGLIAQGEVRLTDTLDDTPATRELQRFNQFQGQILREGQTLGNVVSAQLTYANNLERIETIRSDGKIDGADPTVASLTGNLVDACEIWSWGTRCIATCFLCQVSGMNQQLIYLGVLFTRRASTQCINQELSYSDLLACRNSDILHLKMSLREVFSIEPFGVYWRVRCRTSFEVPTGQQRI